MIIKKNKKQTQGVEEKIESNSGNNESIPEIKPEDIDLFDLDNIDFKQRNERRKGDRRRGFRRIDDRNLISRAREEADAIRENAAKDGYQAGLEMAKDDIAMLKEGLDVFYGSKQEIYDIVANDILQISLDVAKKIIKKETAENPEIILENIKEMLSGLSKEETKLILKVNPTQAEMLKQQVPDFVSTAGLEAKVVVIPDESIMEGGCILTTTNGVIDATIESQIEVISEALKELY
ncbi:flagellar assembly protein FliH [bacterium]|nr:flagellar assembly protein FliH [bacterium]